jgi:hypothetical protein
MFYKQLYFFLEVCFHNTKFPLERHKSQYFFISAIFLKANQIEKTIHKSLAKLLINIMF